MDAIEQILKDHQEGDSSNANKHSRTDSNATNNRKLNAFSHAHMGTGEKTTSHVN
mgnify:CR=1 FL=1